MPFGDLPTPPPRIYFDISYARKDDGKKLGAWFDSENKCWFAPNQKVAEALANNNFRPKGVKRELPGMFKGLVCKEK